MTLYSIGIIYFILTSFSASGAEYSSVYQYDIVFCPEKLLPNYPGEPFPMALLGEKFLCKIPAQNESKQIINQPADANINFYAEIVNSMQCLIYFDGTGWLYHLCPNRGVTQIHRQQLVFSLGRNFTDKIEKRRVSDFYGEEERTYFTREYSEGDECDLSGEKRSTLVRFECKLTDYDRITSITEVSTCRYIIQVSTSRVCSDQDTHKIPIYCGSKVDALKLVLNEQDNHQSEKYPLIGKNNTTDSYFMTGDIKEVELEENIYSAEYLAKATSELETIVDELNKLDFDEEESNLSEIFVLKTVWFSNESMPPNLDKDEKDSKKGRHFYMLIKSKGKKKSKDKN